MKKIYVATNGCEEASLASQRLKNMVSGMSFVLTNDAGIADIIIFYACGHLRARENESLRMISKLMSLKKSSGELFVWGCLTKINPEAIRSIYDGYLIGPERWDFFCDLFEQSEERIQNVHANELCAISELSIPYPHLMPPFRRLN